MNKEKVEIISIWKTIGKDPIIGKYPIGYIDNGEVLYLKEGFIIEKAYRKIKKGEEILWNK